MAFFRPFLGLDCQTRTIEDDDEEIDVVNVDVKPMIATKLRSSARANGWHANRGAFNSSRKTAVNPLSYKKLFNAFKLKQCCVNLETLDIGEGMKLRVSPKPKRRKSQTTSYAKYRKITIKSENFKRSLEVDKNDENRICKCDSIDINDDLSDKICYTIEGLRCPKCDLTFNNNNNGEIFSHIFDRHKNGTDMYCIAKIQYCPKFMSINKEAQSRDKEIEESVCCPNCPIVCKSEMGVKKHNCCTRFVCLWCGYSASKKYDLNLHLINH